MISGCGSEIGRIRINPLTAVSEFLKNSVLDRCMLLFDETIASILYRSLHNLNRCSPFRLREFLVEFPGHEQTTPGGQQGAGYKATDSIIHCNRKIFHWQSSLKSRFCTSKMSRMTWRLLILVVVDGESWNANAACVPLRGRSLSHCNFHFSLLLQSAQCPRNW